MVAADRNATLLLLPPTCCLSPHIALALEHHPPRTHTHHIHHTHHHTPPNSTTHHHTTTHYHTLPHTTTTLPTENAADPGQRWQQQACDERIERRNQGQRLFRAGAATAPEDPDTGQGGWRRREDVVTQQCRRQGEGQDWPQIKVAKEVIPNFVFGSRRGTHFRSARGFTFAGCFYAIIQTYRGD